MQRLDYGTPLDLARHDKTGSLAQDWGMAAKRKIAPPKPRLDLPWTELTKAQQNLLYTRALAAYSAGTGPNPATKGDFFRKQAAAKA